MNTCDTCKWWEPPGTHFRGLTPKEYTENYGLCNNPKVNDSDEVIPVGKVTRELDHASPHASDDHCLCFATGPKFGCIHHEPK